MGPAPTRVWKQHWRGIRLAAVGLVVTTVAVLTWVGWMTGVEALTRVNPTWPVMTPWTSLWLAALGMATLVQSGHPSGRRVWAGQWPGDSGGRSCAAMFLAEYATARSFGLDQAWFGEAVRLRQSSLPGRPSPQTASSLLLVAAAVALIRLEPRWTRVLWPVCLVGGGDIPLVAVAAYLFDAMALAERLARRPARRSRRPGPCCCWSAAASLARSDRSPIAWLLARPDRRSLVRLVGMLAAFPIIVALSRATFLALGLGEHAALDALDRVGRRRSSVRSRST